MAAIERISVSKPAAALFDAGSTVLTATAITLVSVIATNTASTNGSTYIYVVPSGVTNPDLYGIITYNLSISGYNTYETFRFAVNVGDRVRVAGSAGISYYVQGIEQEA
jgi:hypothetical protein